MQKVPWVIVVIVLLAIGQVNSFAFIPTAVEILGLLHTVNHAFDSGYYNSFGNSQLDPEKILKPVFSKIDQLSADMRVIGGDLEIALDKILTHIPLERRIDDDKLKLNEYLVYVNDLYDQYQNIIRKEDVYINETILQFSRAVISPEFNYIPNILGHIHSIIMPKRSSLKEGLFELMLKYNNAHAISEMCNMDVSFQRRVYNLFTMIVIPELRSSTMTSYAYWYLSVHTNVDYTRDRNYAFSQYESRFIDYIKKFKEMCTIVSRDIYRCDPPNLILGKNYEELQGAVTAYFMNTMMLHIPKNHRECFTTCENIDAGLVYACYLNIASKVRHCVQQPCKGVVVNCKTFQDEYAVCESKTSRKRYLDIKPYPPLTSPPAEYLNCTGEDQHFSTLIPLPGEKGTDLRDCYNCQCECIETFGVSTAIRSISFLPQISDIKNNKVLSNIRFILKDKMIHLQIANAPLLLNNEINVRESAWIPLGDIRYKSGDDNTGEFIRINGRNTEILEKNVDYAFVNSDLRILNIDDISAGPNYVVTGVRLNRFVNKIVESTTKKIIKTFVIQLEVHVTPYNATTGKLNPTNDNPSRWISWENQPNPSKEYSGPRQEIKVGGRIYDGKHDVPGHYPMSKPNQFVKFTHSAVPGIDYGQTTVPLIDTQSVSDKNNVAIGGIGLIYRSYPGYAGFIAPKVLNIDMEYYMNSLIPEDLKNSNFKN